jgi:hypothetical protein
MTTERPSERPRQVARIRQFRARVTRQALETGLDRLAERGPVSGRERAVLAVMVWNIARAVVPVERTAPASEPADGGDRIAGAGMADLFEEDHGHRGSTDDDCPGSTEDDIPGSTEDDCHGTNEAECRGSSEDDCPGSTEDDVYGSNEEECRESSEAGYRESIEEARRRA